MSKIAQWEEEIEKISKQQKEMNQKYTDKIRELRRKIQVEQQQLEQRNNELIASTVREIYGEVSEENLAAFKQMMIAAASNRRE